MYTNARSIKNKLDELSATVSSLNPKIIFISETWLHDGITDGCCGIPGFKLYRSDNNINRGYGGVCIYLADDIINFFKVESIIHDLPGIDNLFLRLNSRNFSALISCIYRPRASPSDSLLCDLLVSLSRSTQNLIITGDFNYPDIT